MDAVILAAGRGERLNGVTAPFHKPLLVMNGKPLVAQAVDLAAQVCENVHVVVAPENALPISQVLGNRDVNLIVQRTACGPGHALYIGSQLASDDVLVLLADNLLTFADVKRVTDAKYGVGTTLLDPDAAERFTRLGDGGEWVERVAVDDTQVDPETGMCTVWVGPLVVSVECVRQHYSNNYAWPPNQEWLIGPWIDRLAPVLHTLVPVHSIDVGTLEALT